MTTEPKLSLVASFDDLCRYTAPLTEGIEDEFIKFALNQELCRKKWLAMKLEAQEWQNLYKKSQAEAKAYEAKLINARGLIEKEMAKRVKAEEDKEILERQIALIRELLTDTTALNDQTREKLASAFVNSTCAYVKPRESPKRLNTINESTGSILSLSDISYDRTEDDMDDAETAFLKNPNKPRRSGGRPSDRLSAGENLANKRPSAPPLKEVTPPKRSKSEVVEVCHIDVSITPHIDTPKYETPKMSWSPMPKYSSTSRINSRAHIFCTKTIIKPESCTPCGKRIKFGKIAFKCKDCRAVCHTDCKEQVPLPCVPTTNTPSTKGFTGTIADYTPNFSPMIPGLVHHCVNEIEARGFTEVGIYRIPGSEREVKELKEKFLKGKGVPNLSRLDIHVVCGTLKDFLRMLREPLVTHTLWREFVNAASLNDSSDSISATYQAISELPQPNRDTLAFLILHLQRVSECPDCKMNVSNLAKVFGPTIVGYSCVDPEPTVMIAETRKQAAVMERFMSIPADYWYNFVNVGDECNLGTPTGMQSVLGPLPSSPFYDNRKGVTRSHSATSQTPSAARDSGFKAKLVKRTQCYFASPKLN